MASDDVHDIRVVSGLIQRPSRVSRFPNPSFAASHDQDHCPMHLLMTQLMQRAERRSRLYLATR